MENAVKNIGHRWIAVQREDGLAVFPDGDEKLDDIRLNHKDRRSVILAVALRRFQQIAIGYAKKHAPDLETEITELVSSTEMKLVDGD